LLVTAAKQYGKDSVLRGCMITEGTRADDEAARKTAQTLADVGLKKIRDYLDQALPEKAQCLTDYLSITLRGLSSAACNGMPRKRLIEAAQTAGRFIAHELDNSQA
jgi:TetR/AcrR family transcriptional repressor for divergent bdcA